MMGASKPKNFFKKKKKRRLGNSVWKTPEEKNFFSRPETRSTILVMRRVKNHRGKRERNREKTSHQGGRGHHAHKGMYGVPTGTKKTTTGMYRKRKKGTPTFSKIGKKRKKGSPPGLPLAGEKGEKENEKGKKKRNLPTKTQLVISGEKTPRETMNKTGKVNREKYYAYTGLQRGRKGNSRMKVQK